MLLRACKPTSTTILPHLPFPDMKAKPTAKNPSNAATPAAQPTAAVLKKAATPVSIPAKAPAAAAVPATTGVLVAKNAGVGVKANKGPVISAAVPAAPAASVAAKPLPVAAVAVAKAVVAATRKPAGSSSPAPASAPVAKVKVTVAAEKIPETIISVKVDVGFGNQLFVRGEGPGLSWEKGVPAECVANDLWKIAVKNAAKPVKFKVLVNDATWSAGEDFAVEPGQSVTLTPGF